MEVELVDTVLLDIDGVLNEPQQPITLCMQNKLQQLARHRQVYFVTGNTYTKTVDILNGPIGMYCGVFCNNGDELRTMRGKLVWQDTETPSLPDEIAVLLSMLPEPKRNSVEWRSPRFVNFCPIGRYATKSERDGYDASWRTEFAKNVMDVYSDVLDVSIGGQVSVDIYSKGADKARAAKWINNTGRTFTFIGDKTFDGGNDAGVKRYCDEHTKNKCWTSNGTIHTMELLENILEN